MADFEAGQMISDPPAQIPLNDQPWYPAVGRVKLLSNRERQVLWLLSTGLSNRRIAAALLVSERTVKAHVSGIMVKLRVESRLQAGLVALAYQSLEPPRS